MNQESMSIQDCLKKASTEQLVKSYIKIRDAIEVLEREHKEAIKQRAEKQSMIEEELLARCNDAGGNITIPTVGRVTRRIMKRYWTSDWPALYKIIKENDAFHLLHQRITNNAMDQFLEDNPDLMPAGLNLDSKQTVVVTRMS